MYYVIISRHCANMQQELATAMQGRKDIQVILDRRYGERRADLHRTSRNGGGKIAATPLASPWQTPTSKRSRELADRCVSGNGLLCGV